MGGEVTERILATFALEAHANGVSLPAGKFTATNKTVQAQWNKYIATACGKISPLDMRMSFEVSPTDIKVSISPGGHIDFLRMKPIVEALNNVHTGLGWWVYQTASSASIDRYPIYRVQDLPDFLQTDCGCSDFSDEGLIKDYLEGSGEKILTREEFEKEYQVFWPSELIKAVDDHAWLLNANSYNEKSGKWVRVGKKPPIATLKDAKKFLAGRAPKALKTIVEDFVALHDELNRPKSLMKDASGQIDEYGDGMQPIGASCALVWDSHDMPWSLIQHFEESLSNHGEYCDEHIVFQSDAFNQVSISRLVQSLKDFVTRHAAINKAFTHFEVVKC